MNGFVKFIRRLVGMNALDARIASINNTIDEIQMVQTKCIEDSIQKSEDYSKEIIRILQDIILRDTAITMQIDESTQKLENDSKQILDRLTNLDNEKIAFTNSLRDVSRKMDENAKTIFNFVADYELKQVVDQQTNRQEELLAPSPNRHNMIIPNAKLGRSIISCKDGTRFDINGDFQLFSSIIHDMHVNGKDLVPSGVWSEYSVNTSDDILDIFSRRFSTLKLMLDPWVGQVGMQPVSSEQVDTYKQLLEQIDYCGFVGDDLFTTAVNQDLLNTDLGSMMDVNIIANMLPVQTGKRYFVLEVGGGYGRLAEALTNGIDNSMHYVLVDAVPGSLLYAKEYLERAFPDKRVGFYLNDLYDDSYDFFILPAWQVSQIANTTFDLAINIESMQEMEEQHISFYLKLFDNLVKESGHVYISNSRAYRFKGSWNFPEKWEMLVCNNTPRSWTNDHPTMMFKKTNEICTRQNSILAGLHVQQINDWNLQKRVAALKNEVQWRTDELNTYRENHIL